MIYAALILLLLAVLLFWQAARRQKGAGLPAGKVIYVDTTRWGNKVEKPLYDAANNLTGKPDYLVEEDGRLIPVEVKSGWAPDAPRDSHVFQLAAYCFLVERTSGKRPPYGIIHYRNRTFAVDYTSRTGSRAGGSAGGNAPAGPPGFGWALTRRTAALPALRLQGNLRSKNLTDI